MVSTGEDSDDTSKSYEDSWIVRFMTDKKNGYLDRIPDFFLQDRFNLYGLKEKIEDFEDAYQAIQDRKESINYDTESTVYFLIHQRYVCSKQGMETILERVLNWEYGTCSRIGCRDVPYIPIGLSNEPRKSSTKLFCYNCSGLYEPRGSLKKLDGCAWGTGFAHFLILSFSYHFEKKAAEQYVPRVFGFQIAEPDEYDSS